MSQNKLMDVWSWTHSRRILIFLESANRCCDFYAHNNIINISIPILLHSGSSSANPSSKRAKLDRIGLMATHNSKLGELFLHIFTNNTGLNTSHHVVLINPLNFIHPGHIDWNNWSLLFCCQHQRLCDVGTPTKGNQNHIMLFCWCYQKLCLLMWGYIYYVVYHSF